MSAHHSPFNVNQSHYGLSQLAMTGDPFADAVSTGDLLTHHSQRFREQLEQLMACSQGKTIVLDFQDAQAISAACLGVLAEFAHRVQILNVPPSIQRVFEVTGLNQVLQPAA